MAIFAMDAEKHMTFDSTHEEQNLQKVRAARNFFK